jgi:hypothetical protein
MLAKEKIDILIGTGVYSIIIKPEKAETWCRNWTFTIQEYNGKYYMVDTYWGSSGQSFRIELTDENFLNFKFEIDFEKVNKVSKEVYYEYADDVRFNLATDSGGWQYSKYYVLKEHKPSRERKRVILQDEIKYMERSLQYKLDELIKIDSNDFYE